MTERWPDLGVLELLVTVAELGSLSAAAERLGVPQPSASRSLARFERRVGLSLVERTARGSRVTPDGALFVDWARSLLAEAERFTLATRALRSQHAAQLVVAASMTVAEYLVPRWLGAFRRAHPDVEVTLQVTNSDRVAELLGSGEAEVGFVETTAVPGGLHWTEVGEDRLLVVVAPGHPWARRRRPVGAAELAATPLVLREEGSGTRRTLVDACAVAGLDLVPPAQALGSNAAVRISAMSGAGPAVLSEQAVREQVRSGDLVAVRTTGLDLARRLRAGWAGGRRPVGLVADLVSIARQG